MSVRGNDDEFVYTAHAFAGTAYELAHRPSDRDVLAADLVRGNNPNDWLLGLLRRFAPRGSRVLDIGANVGSFAIPAAALGYEVTAFEAAPANAGTFTAGAQRNRAANLRLVEAAVTDVPGEVAFLADGPTGHITPAGTTAGTVRVRGITIDGYLEEAGGPEVTFVKIDVEGAEPAALRGMEKLLRSPRAPVVVYESNATTLARDGVTPEDLRRTFSGLGYQVFRIMPGYFTLLTPLDSGYRQDAKLIDCLAYKGALSWWARHDWKRLPSRVLSRLRAGG